MSSSISATVRHWYDEGMRRRFVIDRHDRSAVDVPLLVAIVVALFAPWIAVAAVVVAVIRDYSVRVLTPPADSASGSGEDGATGAPGAEDGMASPDESD